MKKTLKRIGILFAMMVFLTILVLFVIYQARRAERQERLAINSKYQSIIRIFSEEDYINFARSVKSGNDYCDIKVVLMADLDFTDCAEMLIIGNEEVAFSGCFDGNGHKIQGIAIENPNGPAAMFWKLKGIVKNLRMENCKFYGSMAGAVAAECYDGSVLNCYLSAEVNGELYGSVVGKLRGNVLNCVTMSEKFVGELSKGMVENCYTIQTMDVNDLNQNLPYLSGYYSDFDFYLWDQCAQPNFTQKAELLRGVSTRINVDRKELKLNGYYSANDKQWCIVLPSSYRNETLMIEAVTGEGSAEYFYRKNEEDTIVFQWKEFSYPVTFLCEDEIDTMYVLLEGEKTLADIHENKHQEVPGLLCVIDQKGSSSYNIVKGFYGHGNDSWAADKKSYNLKLDTASDLLGLGENEDFSFLACYRDNSLMCYVTTTELCKELGFSYTPDFRLVNLYVAGEYAGVYFLAEKVEIDQNRIDISNIYEETKKLNHNYMEGFSMNEWKDGDSPAARYFYEGEKNPEDLTGGYLLEADIVDYGPEESRFVSTRGIPMTMKRAKYSSEAQVNYIADYWQEFEDALFDPTGVNSQGKRYTEYIDLESFAMQWLIYELVQEGSMSSSIYYYKESEQSGDGLLHACFPWDMEHSYVMSDKLQNVWNLTEKKETLYGYWAAFEKHEDFKQELQRVWEEKFLPAIDLMVAEEAIMTEAGMKNLRWYEERIGEIDHLENSRWRKMYPLNRCQINREFLKIRKDVISSWLAE